MTSGVTGPGACSITMPYCSTGENDFWSMARFMKVHGKMGNQAALPSALAWIAQTASLASIATSH